MVKSASKFFSPQTPRNAKSIPIHTGGMFITKGKRGGSYTGKSFKVSEAICFLLSKPILKYTSESDSPS